MPPAARTQAGHELQDHRNKLANSYQSLLNDFSSPDLHSVGNYNLGRLIGKGSFGKVYLASHKLTNGSKVVLKSAKKDDANLAREIHHHRQFLHPHIARLYEVIVTESLVWLVLEYCPGDELYNHLLEHGRMEAGKVQRIFTQLVGAVSYVHAKQCVHRDLKLENILLDKGGNVKLVDFGFTREYQGSTSYLQTWCGTVCYSAPEMLKGEKYAGEKVDVWSLGIILYALLVGELPFDEDDDAATKTLILKEEPKWPEYMPEQAKDLIKKMLSKRPLLRPSLGDILKDPWLAEHAPQQQEILKLQQPAPFSTELEKETLQRMRSAGVDIDTVIENVLSQRCDSLAGWWALLIEKETKKQRRRERKRKEREADAKSIRRLSAASGRLLLQSALGEIFEGDELGESPRSRGRRLTRPNGGAVQGQVVELPKVTEVKSQTPDPERLGAHESAEKGETKREPSRSRSRPPPPPKDPTLPMVRRPRNVSRGSGSMLRNMTTNPDLLSPTYIPPPERSKKKIFYQQPLKQQLAMFKHWFKESAKRAKSPNSAEGGSVKGKGRSSPDPASDGKTTPEHGSLRRDLARSTTGPTNSSEHAKSSMERRPDLQQRVTMPARPRINTASSASSNNSTARKRQSLSPHTLTPHSSYRRSSGLRGRKSTSSSVSSIRSTFQPGPGHQHSLSKASSTSSTSIASPSGLSSASGSRLARSPHNSVKILPSTPTTAGPFPSGIRVSRRPLPSAIGPLPGFAEAKTMFGGGGYGPGSPGVPVFARRKRSVFKGPNLGHTSSSPSGFGRVPSGSGNSRSGSVPGRRSGEIGGIMEEEEEEGDEEIILDEVDDEVLAAQGGSVLEEEDEDDDEEGKWEEVVEHFGPELPSPSPPAETPGGLSSVTGGLDEAVSPVVPVPDVDMLPAILGGGENAAAATTAGLTGEAGERKLESRGRSSIPLTAEALAKKNEEDEKEAAEKHRGMADAVAATAATAVTAVERE